jgi:transcriptional regulator with XRE-family HTH domain
MSDPWETQKEALGSFIRAQRKMANLSLRQLAELTSLSNPYLSQLERGLHQPSVRVLRLISDALNLSAETMLTEAGLINPASPDTDGAGPANLPTEQVISADTRLSEDQKAALIAVYRSMLPAGRPDGPVPPASGAAERDSTSRPD